MELTLLATSSLSASEARGGPNMSSPAKQERRNRRTVFTISLVSISSFNEPNHQNKVRHPAHFKEVLAELWNHHEKEQPKGRITLRADFVISNVKNM